tara:strand:- start:3705 stop:3818 length:114 start_codon:yes stop_codon:yes gene_type:complete
MPIYESQAPFEMRKTIKGKGRTFRSAEEGAGMTKYRC